MSSLQSRPGFRRPKVPTLGTIDQQDDDNVAPDVIAVETPTRKASTSPSKISSKAHTNNLKFEVMLLYLRQQQLEKRWAHEVNTTEGVILRRSKDDYICQPSELPKHVNGFYDEATKLNVKVCSGPSLATEVLICNRSP